METLLGKLALASTVILIAALLLFVLLESLRRGWNSDQPLMLRSMLQRQGADLPQTLDAGLGRQLACAARRCAYCTVQNECADWLAAGGREGFQEFCPNAGFIGQLRDQTPQA